MPANKIALTGLSAQDYMHPEEKFFDKRNPGQVALVRKAFDFLNDAAVQFVRQITEGKWVEINAQTAPNVLDTIQEACRILDYPQLPKIYVRHERSMKIAVGGTDYAQMLIPDYILNEFDSDMQLFVFGNALSMFKGGHVQLATISSVLCNAVPMPMILALQAYLRAADLSSDRGGLLCCQDFSAATRCILAETGLPLSELRFLNEAETLSLAENYLEQATAESFDMITENAKFLLRISNECSPPAVRLKELLAWYRDGYEQILEMRRSRQ